MKTIKFYAFAMLMSALALYSCSSDEESGEDTSAAATNSISVAGNTTTIERAFIKGGEAVENADGVFNYELFFFGEGITADANDNFVGQGNLVSANIYTSSSTGLTSGTYEYRMPGGNPVANTIRTAAGAVNLDFDDPNGFDPDAISNSSSGTIIIEGSGTNARVTLNLIATSGAAILASYDGTFTIVE